MAYFSVDDNSPSTLLASLPTDEASLHAAKAAVLAAGATYESPCETPEMSSSDAAARFTALLSSFICKDDGRTDMGDAQRQKKLKAIIVGFVSIALSSQPSFLKSLSLLKKNHFQNTLYI